MESTVQSTLTCPECQAQQMAEMPSNACVPFYTCKSCGKLVTAKTGQCCVFCSYGNQPCPLNK